MVATRMSCGLRPLVWPTEVAAMCKEAHRLTAAIVEIPGVGDIAFFSIYLVSGEGVGQRNADLLAALGAWCTRMPFETIVDGDWNMATSTLLQTGLSNKLELEVVASKEGTCKKTKGKGYSKIDYFLVSSGVQTRVLNVKVCEETAANPHKPVYLELGGRRRGKLCGHLVEAADSANRAAQGLQCEFGLRGDTGGRVVVHTGCRGSMAMRPLGSGSIVEGIQEMVLPC